MDNSIIKYFVYYEFGFHRHILETTMKDMHTLVDDMSKEFEISYNETTKRLSDSRMCTIRTFSIVNYCGDIVPVAFETEEFIS